MTDALGTAGVLHIALFGVALPLLAWRSRRLVTTQALPGRKGYFLSVIVQQAVFLAISLWVAWTLELPVPGPFRPSLPGLLAAAGLLVTAIVGLRPVWRRQVRLRDRRVHLFAPRDRAERGLWAAVSVMAGVGEEISYRGVLFLLLLRATGSTAAAVLLAAAAFGLGHLIQGWRAAGVVTLFAAAFQGLVLLTGSLHLAIAVHILYDIVAGLAYGRYTAEAGWPAEPPPDDPPAPTETSLTS